MRCLVDMNEMKIAIAVTEFSHAGGAFLGRQRRIMTAETKIVIGDEEGSVKALRVLVCQLPVIIGAVRVVASGTVSVLDRAMRIRIRCQQLLHAGEFLFVVCLSLILDSLVVALQTDIESVSKEQSAFLRRVRVVTVHTGGSLRSRGMLDRRCLQISDGFLMTFLTKIGNCRCQQVLLIGHVWRMTIRASSQCGFVPESRGRKPCAHILVTFQAHLWAGDSQHSGNIASMRIVASETRPCGERSMDGTAFELILFMALKAKRFGCIHKPRLSSFGRDLMARLA